MLLSSVSAVAGSATTSPAASSFIVLAPSSTMTWNVSTPQSDTGSPAYYATIGSVVAVIAIVIMAIMLAICVVSAVLHAKKNKRNVPQEVTQTVAYFKDGGEVTVYMLHVMKFFKGAQLRL